MNEQNENTILAKKKKSTKVGRRMYFVHYFIAILFLCSLILFHILSAVIWDESSGVWFDDKCLPVSQFIAAIITADSLISELTFRSLFIMTKKPPKKTVRPRLLVPFQPLAQLSAAKHICREIGYMGERSGSSSGGSSRDALWHTKGHSASQWKLF